MVTSPRVRRRAVARAQRRGQAQTLALETHGIVRRRDLYAMGFTRWEIRANVKAGRWQRVGTQSVCVHTGPLEREARWVAALNEAGPRSALDGETALIAAGLRSYESPVIRVSVPRGAKVRRFARTRIRQTRRWSADDVVTEGGVRRTGVGVAAVRAALWAVSDRQATLLLTLPVQQGLVRAEDLGREALRVRRDKRRRLLHEVIDELLGGARSIGEIDFARECRRRGLPTPTRQQLRRGRNGRYYLDVWWRDYRLVVEIDGIQHARADHVVPDALRQNDLTLQGDRVLRLPVLGLRVAPDEFFDQVEAGLVAGGWTGRCPAS